MHLACHSDDDPIDATFQHFELGYDEYPDPYDEDEYDDEEEFYYDEDEGDDYYYENYPEFSDYEVEND